MRALKEEKMEVNLSREDRINMKKAVESRLQISNAEKVKERLAEEVGNRMDENLNLFKSKQRSLEQTFHELHKIK